MKVKFLIFFLITCFIGYSQTNETKLDVRLNVKKHQLIIKQELIIYNTSKDTLTTIYLHNWANSFKDNDTFLTKRLLEDYDKSLYFAKKEERGFSKINNLKIKSKNDYVFYKEISADVIKVNLKNSLKPNDSIVFIVDYIVQIPLSKFTDYGRKNSTYNLRYWYLSPVVFDDDWQLMSNYNIDDLYESPTNFDITFSIPNAYTIQTDLNLISKKLDKQTKVINFSAKNKVDLEINISKKNNFKNFKTPNLEIISNINIKKIKEDNANALVKRQLDFMTKHLGKYPHDKLLINNITYKKNPVYGFNQLPKMFNPFNNVFEFDIKMFKALTNKYINTTILTNRRKDTWLNDGIQTYLMLKYVEKYYPEIKAVGEISKVWGIRNYKIAKIDFNEKYPFVYQFAAFKYLDQALTTRTDSLSTFNRKIVNKYKAGLGLKYLDNYLNNNIVPKSLVAFYTKNKLKNCHSNSFKKIIKTKTSKKLNWFFGDYLNTNKKIDYTIKKVEQTNDSIKVLIKNKSNINVPISVYGIKDKSIKYKAWFEDIANTKTITIAKNNFDKVTLNYEYIYPEINLKNNWKNIKPKLFNRPIQFRFFKDIENPNYNQIFYSATVNYNLYDGLLIGPEIYNKSLFKKKWLYTINPTYGTKSQQVKGLVSLQYQHYFNNSEKFRKVTSGISLSNFQYAPNLSYNRISPYVVLTLKRKSLRNVGQNSISARLVAINKEIEKNSIALEADNYKIFNLRYVHFKPEIIKDIRYNIDFQYASNFSKFSLDVKYRKLTRNKRQFDFRLYAGTFIHNKTKSNFFDFSLNRPSDYLFDYGYLGRSESVGFYSQQFINTEGSFKSFFEDNTANQWIVTSNNSVNIWRWIELYGDAGFIKSKNFKPIFKYDSGVRLNFIHNFLEIYFPVQSSNGFEVGQQNYTEKIRYVITINPGKIYNFIKRGFY